MQSVLGQGTAALPRTLAGPSGQRRGTAGIPLIPLGNETAAMPLENGNYYVEEFECFVWRLGEA